MSKSINKKIIISLLTLILSFGFFQAAQAITKAIGETATITVTCSDPDANLSQCNVTSPCTQGCSASGSSGSCSCQFTCIAEGTYDACGEARDTEGLSDIDCLDTVTCIIPNQPPVANICCQSCSSPNCTTYTGQVFTLINDSSDPDGDSDIVRSEWDILNWGQDPDLSCSNICDYTVQTQILGAGDYTAELYIEDTQAQPGIDTQAFTIKQSALADFQCSLDNTNWQACQDIQPNVDEIVYFLDQSSPPEDGSITSWSWTFQDGNPNTATGTNPSTQFQSAGSKEVTLTLGVTAGSPASETKTISVQLPLPEWQEIPPFSWIKKFLAIISEIFDRSL